MRGRSKSGEGLLVMVGATIAVPYLTSKAFPVFFHDDPRLVLSAALWVLIIGLATSLLCGSPESNSTGTRRHVVALTRKHAKTHLKTLRIKKSQMIFIDDYGVLVDKGFEKELDYFIDRVIAPSLDGVSWRTYRRDMIAVIKERIDEHSGPNSASASSSEIPTNPIAFERWCIGRLADAGWQARPTPATGDQGADCVATKDDLRIVLQCKLHASPCGNKAVQEASAARNHYQAEHGIVVATNGFTKSARHLAATNNIHLIHADQLSEIDAIIGGRRAATMAIAA
jgi:restriction system protein